jgi:hypothetical protein
MAVQEKQPLIRGGVPPFEWRLDVLFLDKGAEDKGAEDAPVLAPAGNKGVEDAPIDNWCIVQAHANEAEEHDEEDNINDDKTPQEDNEEDDDENENEEPGFPLEDELADGNSTNNTHNTDGISDDHDNVGDNEACNKDEDLLEDEQDEAATEDQEQLETTHTHGLQPNRARGYEFRLTG